MEKILLLSEDLESLARWDSVLSLATKKKVETRLLNGDSVLSFELMDKKTILLIDTENMSSDYFARLFTLLEGTELRVICTGGMALRSFSIEQLVKKGLRAILHLSLSVPLIGNILYIVENGGVFVEEFYEDNQV